MFASCANCFQSCQSPQRIRELIARTSQAAIGKSFGKQAIVAHDAALGSCASAQCIDVGQCRHHVGLKLAQRTPVLAQLALPHQREQSDSCVFIVLSAAAGDHLSGFFLHAPRGAKTFGRLLVVAEISRGFKDEISIDDPETPITRRSHLKRKLAIFRFASLQNIARAGCDKFASPSRYLPGNRRVERGPRGPEFPRRSHLRIRIFKAALKVWRGLSGLRKANECAVQLRSRCDPGMKRQRLHDICRRIEESTRELRVRRIIQHFRNQKDILGFLVGDHHHFVHHGYGEFGFGANPHHRRYVH